MAKKTKTKAEPKTAKPAKPEEYKGGGLIMPEGMDRRVGKNLRRVLRAKGVRLSEMPGVRVPVKQEGSGYSVTVNGTEYRWEPGAKAAVAEPAKTKAKKKKTKAKKKKTKAKAG